MDLTRKRKRQEVGEKVRAIFGKVGQEVEKVMWEEGGKTGETGEMKGHWDHVGNASRRPVSFGMCLLSFRLSFPSRP